MKRNFFIFIFVLGIFVILFLIIFYNKQKVNQPNFTFETKEIPVQIEEIPIKEKNIDLEVKEIEPQELEKNLNSKNTNRTIESTSSLNSTSTSNSLDNFAKCLTEKGVELYVSKTCPHCTKQKEMFGNSLLYLKYFDCLENPEICIKKSIEVVPTWILPNGERLLGVQSFEILSQKTGCKLK